MKKNVLLQLALIFIGITTFLAGFTSFLPRVVVLLSNINTDKQHKGLEYGYLTIEVIRVCAGLILVLKSAGLSEFISDRIGFDDSLTIYTKPRQLFSILLLIIALSNLIEHGAFLVNGIVLFFIGSPLEPITGHGHAYTLNEWAITLSHVTVALLFIIFIKDSEISFSRLYLLMMKL